MGIMVTGEADEPQEEQEFAGEHGGETANHHSPRHRVGGPPLGGARMGACESDWLKNQSERDVILILSSADV